MNKSKVNGGEVSENESELVGRCRCNEAEGKKG